MTCLTEANEYTLRHFISDSPLGRLRRAAPSDRMCAWQDADIVSDETGFPKQGKHSAGVARQYRGTLGKVGNCQVAVTARLATKGSLRPSRLGAYLPES